MATYSNCSAELRKLHVPGRFRLLLLQGDCCRIYQLRQGKKSPAINRFRSHKVGLEEGGIATFIQLTRALAQYEAPRSESFPLYEAR